MKEKLKQMGLTDEQIEKVVNIHKTELDNEYIPKYRFDEKLKEIKAKDELIIKKEQDYKELEKLAGDTDKYKALSEKLEQEAKEFREKSEKDLINTKKDYALAKFLTGKVVDIDVAKSFFDKEKLKLNEKDEIIDGADDVYKMIEKDKKYMLLEKNESKEKKGIKIFGNNPKDPGNKGEEKDENVEFVKDMFGGLPDIEQNNKIIDMYTNN